MDAVAQDISNDTNKNINIQKAENGFVIVLNWREPRPMVEGQFYQDYEYKNKTFIFNSLEDAVDTITAELS